MANKNGDILKKVAFWTIVAVTILFATSIVLSAIGINSLIVRALQGVASAIMVLIVAVLAWRYVKSKSVAWKILYFVCLLVVIAGIVVPLVI